MFEFKGTAAADTTGANSPDGRVTDHQDMHRPGRRSLTPMISPTTPPTLRHRALTEDVRRPKVLQKRSRSNTSIGSLTPYEGDALSPAISIDRSTSGSSADRRSVAGSIHARASSADSFGKTLMAKGSRLLRRQNSKQDLTSLQTLDWLPRVDGQGPVQEMSNRPGSRQSRSLRSRIEDGSPKYNISEPFNFQHLTHTTPHHVPRIDEASHDDLVSEFSAIRAAQKPRRQLQGIRTIEVQRGTFLSQASRSDSSPAPNTGYGQSPPQSPERPPSRGNNGQYHVASPTRSFHHPSRSIESFSQPSPRRRSPQSSPGHASPTSPPPRTSSRAFAPDFFTIHQESPTHTTIEPQIPVPEFQSLDYPIATSNDGLHDFSLPHAVTTPDDSAHSLTPLPFSMIRTELTGVPEEDESSDGRRSSITTLARSSTPTLRHAKSFPSSRMSPQRWSGVLPLPTEDRSASTGRHSTMSSSLAPPPVEEHNEDIPIRPQVTRRVSTCIEDSWEDVIDDYYNNEAEADCNFEWDYIPLPLQGNQDQTHAIAVNSPVLDAKKHREISSTETEASIGSRNHNLIASHSRSSSNYSQCSQPTLLPLQTFLPNLEPPSATSAESSFSSIQEAITPSQVDGLENPLNASSNNSKQWHEPANASPLVMPNEYGPPATIQDELYNQIFSGEFVQSDHHFPWIFDRVAGSTISNSPRSSRSQISKSSSQESFRHSTAFSAAQQRRQRNTSVGSLPELLPSRTSRERVDSIVEKLADHVSILDVSDVPVVPVPSTVATTEQRLRNSKLAKEVALKSIISRAMTEEEVAKVPLPVHPAFRDTAPIPVDTSIPMGPLIVQGAVKRKMRSTSSTGSLTSPRASRSSYSLFPPGQSPVSK